MCYKTKMRSEQEMFDLILSVAKADERVRAVYMNGSRTNPNVPKDIYQDYDVVFTVTETESFLADKNWIFVFGDLAIVQEPDLNDIAWGGLHDFSRRYAWLMLFRDSNRIDLSIEIQEETTKNILDDTLTIPLLDKDHILPKIPSSNDSGYWIKPPVKEKYLACCNEFWWCLNNVAKGIARDQLSYAMRMYLEIVHGELEKMIEWYVGINNNFRMTSGMWGKYFKKHLPSDLNEMYANTYSDGNYDKLWASIFTACELFRIVAIQVAEHFGYTYNTQDDENIMVYLGKIRNHEFG